MNRNKTDNNTEAVKIANALKPFAKKWFDEWGQSCVRSKKMTVSTAPNGSVIGVTDAFSDTEIFIKYMSSCSNAVVGDTVWCKWMFDNMQTLYASEIGNLRQSSSVYSNSASGNYAKVLTFGTDAQTSRNLFDMNASVAGYLTSAGTAINSPDQGNRTSDFIAVSEGLQYCYTAYPTTTSNPWTGWAFYSSASMSSVIGTRQFQYNTSVVVTVPTGANFIRIGSRYLEGGKAQFELGSTPTPYVPYSSLSNINVNAPITLEYANTGYTSPVTLTINFNRDYSLASFTKDASADAYLHNSATATWDLYIGKASSSDSVEVLDFHNPWSNSDMTITWGNTSISTLPTGYVEASPFNTVTYITPNGVSVSSGSWKTVAEITFTRGIWVVSAFAQFNSNATGRRGAIFSETQDDGTAYRSMSNDNQVAVNGALTFCRFVDIYEVSSSKTFYLNAYQDSGSALTTYGRIYAVKIA
jgi:hypothetical protein